MSSKAISAQPTRKALFVLAVCLLVILTFFFWKSFQNGQALFSNDGPLGAQSAGHFKLPGAFFGIWNSLYWLGSEAGSFTPNITGLELFLLGPVGYTNFHGFVALFLLGFCSWLFFYQLRFNAVTCVLAALAAAFNMNFVSNLGWGLSSRALSLAMAFLALAAIESSFRGRSIIKIILAGLATGMSVSEGGDNGAIFSLFVAAFAFVRTWAEEGPAGERIVKGLGRVGIMAACAAVLAAQTLNIFVEVAVKGIVGTEQKQLTPEQQWDWATQWSLPKKETLRVIIPGIYGYKTQSGDGSQYWGGVGRDSRWTPEYGQNGARSSGAGEYAGVLVVLLALWALGQSIRSTGSPYSTVERRMIWFWAVAAVVALGFAWGRYAPFYRIVFSLPYFSAVRNAMKFMHPFHLCLMVLFAF
ncbi:MAG TPA: hypothetical protein VK633_01125, partial [Verrucomicrobiae bacterium]|nr:hypothetical protein [Verrucomicrobiae bacterium]